MCWFRLIRNMTFLIFTCGCIYGYTKGSHEWILNNSVTLFIVHSYLQLSPNKTIPIINHEKWWVVMKVSHLEKTLVQMDLLINFIRCLTNLWRISQTCLIKLPTFLELLLWVLKLIFINCQETLKSRMHFLRTYFFHKNAEKKKNSAQWYNVFSLKGYFFRSKDRQNILVWVK